MKRTFAATLVLALVLAAPASAHRLKIFAHVAGDTIAGYGFYIGGGRPQGVEVTFSDGAGREIGTATTGADGAYSFTPPGSGTYRLKINGGDGHFAEATVAFTSEGDAGVPATPTETPSSHAENQPSASALPAIPAQSSAELSPQTVRLIEESVDKAVSRQITPLLEAYDAADGKVRFNDIIGGLGWIVGLAGLYLWFRARLAAVKSPNRERR